MVNREVVTVFIVGPTASGKSSVALEVAKQCSGEIVCADSQTLRRDLDIGTAKPSEEDQATVRHHLLDIIDPYEEFSVHDFKCRAEAAIRDIQSRGKLPIVVGGTGLYIDALLFDYSATQDKEQEAYKKQLEQYSVEQLQEEIRERDYELPTNSRNPRHLIGVLLREGRVHKDRTPIEGARIYGIRQEDEVLKKRIKERIQKMFDLGFVQEVEGVIEKYGEPPRNIDAIGYSLANRHLKGEITLNELQDLFERAHWQYARRQKAWFKRNTFITWLNTPKDALEKIQFDLSLS